MKPSRKCSYSEHFHNFFRSFHCRKLSFTSNTTNPGTPPVPGKANWVYTEATQVSTLRELLQSCARNRAATGGKACHGQIVRVGLQADTLISNMLINMYSKCGLVECARNVFDEMPVRSLISWNTMIGSCTQNGDGGESLGLFVCMQREGARFSEFTISGVLCACAAKCAVLECKQLHAFALKAAMDSNMFVATALLGVYAKSSFIEDASRIFECMPERSAVTWSSMIAAYVQNDLYEEALVLFQRAQTIGLENNQFSMSSVVSACANLAALIEGSQMHAVILKSGLESNIFVASSLIELYAKCGIIREAYTVFSSVEEKNVVLWNAMISGFSKHACCIEAMISFEKMQQMGICPNEITYVSVLSVCGHMGLVEKGWRYFDMMRKEHNLSPNVLHYSCMADVLGRAGLICEARHLLERMPFDATASMWGSLLSSCRIHGNTEIAEVAARHLFEIEPNNAGNHVLLSNTYAATKKWDEVARTRKLLKDSEAKKERGKSWIEVKNKVHIFMVGERSHPRIAKIYSRLEDLLEEMKKLDYKVCTEYDLHDVEEIRKQELLRHHSEKLALTFGLMSLPSCAPIRIMKNLRICGDCHTFMKLASKITAREIIIRDTNRFHHFQNGVCSCGDFW
ncbi:pentatricopeptide repeat-containing protein At5g04780, mitochondrial [Diospyros lotus]|uniref:pentatricopeptide repeat-containing protein At5g04780, mitochondrial n=1 Tax=Diospyros lotus TaxID=55363 RepID=UPI002258EBBD|nr:pentatricopeptide repeat-containing protein At5g04780, mitochondrial [Diospyros lotus]XP_052187991.1 pentatricopeptide repeat-containing protein At5g04780, mitochondrial [Diospyros lotus]XP_052187992.1 pentatricopeptide repeat-containing protein At5g04780, mitochondrial [Diospyros lotus]XP_052187993.1 pentatricopeptide repeat-containing protein At5g04780, mitochondrial [Diospyros lotus]XP_052187994.1 pentatricopeptide repeat-containing protein At5g04780, mitochondrial [Diospyros lotus]